MPCSTSGPRPYAKRTSSKVTRPAISLERDARRRVHDLGLLVEQVGDLVERRDRGEERVVELRQLLHRVEEVRQVAEERDERADRDLAVEREPAAVAEHDRGRGRREEVDEREVDAAQDDRLHVRLRGSVALTAWKFSRAACSRVNDCSTRMPAMSSASVAVTAPSVSRTARYARAERLRKIAVAEREDGMTVSVASASRQSRKKRTTAGPDERERVLDERRDAVGDELVERLDVVRQPADDHAGAVPLVEAEREPLQVAEEVVAQVGEHALARPAGEVRLPVGERDAEHARRDEERDVRA